MRAVLLVGSCALLAPWAVAVPSTVVLTANGQASKQGPPGGDDNWRQQKKPYRQNVNGSTPSGWIQMGTPKKYLKVIFDTGSDKLVAKTWETVSDELASIDAGIGGMVMPSELIYNHNSSKSYHRKFVKNKDGKLVPKQSAITYGSGTAITDEGTEDVLVGNRVLDNFTVMEITADSLQLLHTSKGIAGVLGLQHMKNQSLGHSLFSRMRGANLLTSFGYCRGTGNNGTFIWGDDSTEGTKLDVIGQMHWAVTLGGIMVHWNDSSASLLSKATGREIKKHQPDALDDIKGSDDQDDGTSADVTGDSTTDVADISVDNAFTGTNIIQEIADAIGTLQNTCPNNKCTAILDTGSNIIAGPSAAMKALNKLVNVKPDCSNFNDLPVIKFNLGGLNVTAEPAGYVMKVPMPEMPMGGDGTGEGEGEGDGGGAESGLVRKETPSFIAEERVSRARAATERRWKGVFDRLNRDYGVDLRDTVDTLLKEHNSTSEKFLCMPALVPLDKKTAFGPLFVVGTPLMDTYYTRWSFAKKDESPTVHLTPLDQAKTCHDDDAQGQDINGHPNDQSALTAVKDTKASGMSQRKRGPIQRKVEEISFPHWAKDLQTI